MYIYIYWLVVWNMNFIFPYIYILIYWEWSSQLTKSIIFRGLVTTNQFMLVVKAALNVLAKYGEYKSPEKGHAGKTCSNDTIIQIVDWRYWLIQKKYQWTYWNNEQIIWRYWSIQKFQPELDIIKQQLWLTVELVWVGNFTYCFI
jgi:hypothetical protein